VVERGGLENRCACKRTEGSNPSLSAILPLQGMTIVAPIVSDKPNSQWYRTGVYLPIVLPFVLPARLATGKMLDIQRILECKIARVERLALPTARSVCKALHRKQPFDYGTRRDRHIIFSRYRHRRAGQHVEDEWAKHDRKAVLYVLVIPPYLVLRRKKKSQHNAVFCL
jgi:hypothetical protein